MFVFLVVHDVLPTFKVFLEKISLFFKLHFVTAEATVSVVADVVDVVVVVVVVVVAVVVVITQSQDRGSSLTKFNDGQNLPDDSNRLQNLTL